MTNQRDPRVDPQPGDVCQKHDKRTVWGRHVGRVYIEVDDTPADPLEARPYPRWSPYRQYVYLSAWRKWAKGAEVIHVAD